jgi:hypothetical protein
MAAPGLTQVAFLFPMHSEVRYLESVPVRGQRVRTLDGGLWFVRDVETDSTGTPNVTCVGASELLRDVRRRARTMRDLTLDVRGVTTAAARRAVEGPH